MINKNKKRLNYLKCGLILTLGITLFGKIEKVEAANHSEGHVEETQRITLSRQKNEAFINRFAGTASQIAQENGLYASVMIAQAILESDFGNSVLASAPHHNLFGIKGAYNSGTTVMTTNEFIENEWVVRQEYFRSYPSYYASLLNNARLLRNGNTWNATYYQGTWLENTRNYTDATAWLENRYATDPTYGSKLNSLIERYNLTQYDSVKTGAQQSQPVQTLSETSSSIHTVGAGDTLFNIAQRYPLSVSELRDINGLTTNTIQIGQRLNVSTSKPISYTQSHIVEAGDTLYNIANRYDVSVVNLKATNQLGSNNIRIGQRLQIDTTTTSNAGTKTHIVQAGDTLYNIARRYQTTVSDLQAKNNLMSHTIRLGQALNY